MEKEKPFLGKVKIDLEELRQVSGGELTEEEKAECWETAKRLKMVTTLEGFMDYIPPGEKRDYIVSIWDQVDAPFVYWGLGDDGTR